MSNGPNAIQNNKNTSAILATDGVQDKLESDSRRKVGEDLLKESTNYSDNSKAQADKAREYLAAADALEKMADAVRVKAEQLRNNEITKEKAVKEVVHVVGTVLQIPVPKNATPEMLENIAEELEAKAKENRRTADDLLKQSEESSRLAKQLKEQAEIITRKDMNLSDIHMKSAQAHNEGLNMVFKKLGIYRLDAEYKEQIAYSQKKAAEDPSRG